ncbi:helix-turn-helix transcriptional regulator [Enhygromyxa salina]|uniref:helix-turn-helix transcriptional regulator n=1 Tax=Enhygromyxa salina TaxID=215803 RepID=UPI000D023F6E
MVGRPDLGVPSVGDYEVLSTNLHRLTFEQNLTLEEVARRAGITLEQLEAICSGEVDPVLDLVDLIAKAVGVTASELLAEPDFN